MDIAFSGIYSTRVIHQNAKKYPFQGLFNVLIDEQKQLEKIAASPSFHEAVDKFLKTQGSTQKYVLASEITRDIIIITNDKRGRHLESLKNRYKDRQKDPSFRMSFDQYARLKADSPNLVLKAFFRNKFASSPIIEKLAVFIDFSDTAGLSSSVDNESL